MSQHFLMSTHEGAPIRIIMGWDRPLQGYFMVIEYLDRDEEYLYSNLDDVSLGWGSISPSIDYFVQKLAALGLAVPAEMIADIVQDGVMNVGNRCVYYDQPSEAVGQAA